MDTYQGIYLANRIDAVGIDQQNLANVVRRRCKVVDSSIVAHLGFFRYKFPASASSFAIRIFACGKQCRSMADSLTLVQIPAALE